VHSSVIMTSDNDLDDLLEEVEDKIAEVKNKIKQTKAIKEAEERLNAAVQVLKGPAYFERLSELMEELDYSTRDLPDSERAHYLEKQKEHGKTIDDLRKQLEGIKNQAEREKVFGPDRATDDKPQLKRQNSADIVGAIHDQQDDTLRVLKDIEGTADATHEVAEETKKKLGDQRMQLEGADRDLDDMDDGITRSRKYLKGIIMSLQRDKCIRGLLFIVLAGALFILIWAIVDPNFSIVPPPSPPSSASAVTSTPTPPPILPTPTPPPPTLPTPATSSTSPLPTTTSTTTL